MTETQPEPTLHAEPDMQSAGAELMALSWRMEGHPEFAGDAARIREIGAWASMGRMSDSERSLLRVMGAMFGAMGRRNYAFREDLPIASQFEEFMASVPEPLHGEVGYVDQDTLPPVRRRDTFTAEVTMSDIRVWTAADGVERALARRCTVRPPNGVADDTMVYAEGAETRLLVEGTATLLLRSAGGALRVQAEPSTDG